MLIRGDRQSLLAHILWSVLGTVAAALIGAGVARMGCSGRVDDAVTGRIRSGTGFAKYDRIVIVDLGPEFRPSTAFDWDKGRDAKCAQLARAIDNLVALGASVVAIDYHLGRRSVIPQDGPDPEEAGPAEQDLTYCTPRSVNEPMFRALKKNARKVVVPVYLEVGPDGSIRRGAREHGPAKIVRRIEGLHLGLVNVAVTEGVVARMPSCVSGAGKARYCGLGVEAARLAARPKPFSSDGETLRFGRRSVSLWDGDLDFAPFRFDHDVPLGVVAAEDPKTVPEPIRRRIDGAVVFVGNRNDCLCRLGDRTSGDVHATPFGYLTGLEIHASVAASLLSGRGLVRPGAWLWAGWLLLFGLGAFLVGRYGPLAASVPASLVLTAASGLAVVWFRHAHEVLLPLTGALLCPASGFLFGLGGRLRAVGIERFRLWVAFRHYLSPDVIKEVLRDPSKLRLGGHRRHVSILFSDIRGFTGFSEKMAPDALVSCLNEYFSVVTDILMLHRGYLDKYIGDAVMGIFGAPAEAESERAHACQACAAALDMVRAVQPLNLRWVNEGRPALAIGVGVNTGEAAVGNMGSARRFNYTAVGDSVNLSSRLESLNKEYGTAILCGSRTRALAGGDFVFREVDLVRVKGRREPEPVYELLCRSGEEPATDIASYEAALLAYRAQDFDRVLESLAALLDRFPGDGPASVLFERAKVLAAAPPPEDWDGVYTMKQK